jgi:hypothetical protein
MMAVIVQRIARLMKLSSRHIDQLSEWVALLDGQQLVVIDPTGCVIAEHPKLIAGQSSPRAAFCLIHVVLDD